MTAEAKINYKETENKHTETHTNQEDLLKMTADI